MKTEPRLIRCETCKLLYSPDHNSRLCPHPSTAAPSALLSELRAQGPPYKLESWKHAEA